MAATVPATALKPAAASHCVSGAVLCGNPSPLHAYIKRHRTLQENNEGGGGGGLGERGRSRRMSGGQRKINE